MPFFNQLIVVKFFDFIGRVFLELQCRICRLYLRRYIQILKKGTSLQVKKLLGLFRIKDVVSVLHAGQLYRVITHETGEMGCQNERAWKEEGTFLFSRAGNRVYFSVPGRIIACKD